MRLTFAPWRARRIAAQQCSDSRLSWRPDGIALARQQSGFRIAPSEAEFYVRSLAPLLAAFSLASSASAESVLTDVTGSFHDFWVRSPQHRQPRFVRQRRRWLLERGGHTLQSPCSQVHPRLVELSDETRQRLSAVAGFTCGLLGRMRF